ncbi:MAG: hypothetical protein JRH16_07235 [Deltaproteobacteria bacterium]|nr:hypothetical protein [Deltaproteobacteria bacterium]MBW2359996.1 hypothetical protein [Deltaproteobacteria bacterium]
MMRCIAALLLLAGWCGCQSAPEPQPLALHDAKWASFLQILPSALGPASELEKRRQRRGIPLRFRVDGADVTAVQERVQSDPHCGDMLEVFVRELPPPSATAVGSEEVLELGFGQEVIERWPVPPDKPVVAIRDDEIFVPHSVPLPDSRTLAVLLAIRQDGSFRVTSRRDFAAPERIVCPDAEALRNASVPERSCRRFPNASSYRVLAYEGACLAAQP